MATSNVSETSTFPQLFNILIVLQIALSSARLVLYHLLKERKIIYKKRRRPEASKLPGANT